MFINKLIRFIDLNKAQSSCFMFFECKIFLETSLIFIGYIEHLLGAVVSICH
jgi:hypothetical protein